MVQTYERPTEIQIEQNDRSNGRSLFLRESDAFAIEWLDLYRPLSSEIVDVVTSDVIKDVRGREKEQLRTHQILFEGGIGSNSAHWQHIVFDGYHTRVIDLMAKADGTKTGWFALFKHNHLEFSVPLNNEAVQLSPAWNDIKVVLESPNAQMQIQNLRDEKVELESQAERLRLLHLRLDRSNVDAITASVEALAALDYQIHQVGFIDKEFVERPSSLSTLPPLPNTQLNLLDNAKVETISPAARQFKKRSYSQDNDFSDLEANSEAAIRFYEAAERAGQLALFTTGGYYIDNNSKKRVWRSQEIIYTWMELELSPKQRLAKAKTNRSLVEKIDRNRLLSRSPNFVRSAAHQIVKFAGR